MSEKSHLKKQIVAVEQAADECLNIAVCKTIPIQSLRGRTLAQAAAEDTDARLSDDPVFAPVRRLRDWSRAARRGMSEHGPAPHADEFSQILRDLKSVSASEPTGTFEDLVAKSETLRRTLSERPSRSK
jgi:hypothetical protein